MTPLEAVAGAAAAGALWVMLRRAGRVFGREIQAARAREAFALERERLPELFRLAAAATGRPRGLTWSACEFGPDWVLARDRAGRLVALVPVTVHFEAVPGGGLDDNPNAGLPRQATAVFTFARGAWVTAGRAFFNLAPADALARLADQLELVRE